MVMEAVESFDRVDQGLRRAASCCRELGAKTTINAWFDVSRQLLLMLQKAKFIYDSPPLSEMEVQALVINMEVAQKASAMLRGIDG